MGTKGIVTNIINKHYTVLLYEKQGNDWHYKVQGVSEEQLVRALKSGKLELDNVGLSNKGELKGTTGDLKRFGGKVKPLVILAEIRHEKAGLLGYRVAGPNGEVKRIKLSEAIGYASQRAEAGLIPFQNGIFVRENEERKAHIKSYLTEGFRVDEIADIKNKHAEPAKIDEKVGEKAVSKIDELFTEKQKIELVTGKKNGVDIRIYANNKLSHEQMRVIREGLEDKLPMQLVASPEYSVALMGIYAADMRYGIDVRNYLNPKYTVEQVAELSAGYLAGVDISKYADPKNTALTMQESRIRLERDFWKAENMPEDGNWI